ncbi:MAG: hypothetical protein OHK0046_26760 [Anaerolineae bacterium]
MQQPQDDTGQQGDEAQQTAAILRAEEPLHTFEHERAQADTQFPENKTETICESVGSN